MIKMQLLKVKVYKKEVMSGVKSGKWKVSFRMSIYGQVNDVQQALLEKKLSHIKTITFKSYESQLHNPHVKESYINLNSHLLGNRAVNILFDSLNRKKDSSHPHIH